MSCVFSYPILKFIYKVRDALSSENLELLVLEITRLRSRPFLVSAWYRFPDSPVIVFNDFKKVVMKIDTENWEFFLLRDLNVDLMPGKHQLTLLNSNISLIFRDLTS